ncbi:MAG: phosphate signaling complex protein PhoU [Elusimicrobiota bacterium]
MTREIFQARVRDLEKELVEMGEMVIQAISRSVEALKSGDQDSAKKIISADKEINRVRWDIEEKCVNLMATQQPVATDLRDLIAILNIIVDLERMGDHAEGIAKIVLLIGTAPLVKPLIDVPKMAEKTVEMIRRSMEAFVKRDAEGAKSLCSEDDVVDKLHEQVYHELLGYMIKDPKTITGATYLIWVSHNLERIADRVTNICERIVFLVTGKMEEMNVSSY